jgi:hypothetical protein
MSTNTVAVQVPAALYQRLERLAALTNRPLESLLVQTLSAGLPPLPDDLPVSMRDALLALEQLDDTELYRVVRERMPDAQVEQYDELRERRRAGVITEAEQQTLTTMAHNADLLMLRKAYAAVLLKWRGQRVPTLAELEA